jgi:hypothetical protein
MHIQDKPLRALYASALDHVSVVFAFVAETTKWYLYGGTLRYARVFAIQRAHPPLGTSIHVLPRWPFVKVYRREYRVEYNITGLDSTWKVFCRPVASRGGDIVLAEIRHVSNPHFYIDVTSMVNSTHRDWEGMDMNTLFPILLAAHKTLMSSDGRHQCHLTKTLVYSYGSRLPQMGVLYGESRRSDELKRCLVSIPVV